MATIMTMPLERTMHEAVSMGTEDKMETSRKFELPGNMGVSARGSCRQ